MMGFGGCCFIPHVCVMWLVFHTTVAFISLKDVLVDDWGTLLPQPKNRTSREHFPTLQVPAGKTLWGMAVDAEYAALDDLLEPFKIGRGDEGGEFYVTDEESEGHLNKIRRQIDTSLDSVSYQSGVVMYLLVSRSGGGAPENDELLKKFLALGADPDLTPEGDKDRPSHLCGYYNRPKSAVALSLCRPSLDAQAANEKGLKRTPLEVARFSNHLDVAAVWENAAKNGFPSLAQLAHDREWFAVQNLCRRKVTKPSEAWDTFKGETAVDWATIHGMTGLAKEMLYLLPDPDESQIRRLWRKSYQDSLVAPENTASSQAVENQQENKASGGGGSIGSKLTQLEAKIDGKLDSIAAGLKTWVKEGVAEALGRENSMDETNKAGIEDLGRKMDDMAKQLAIIKNFLI